MQFKDSQESRAASARLQMQMLQAELARIDVMLQREVRRWQLAGQDAGDAFRGLYVSDAQADALLRRPPFSSWGQCAALPAEDQHAFDIALRQAEQQARALKRAARAQGEISRLEQLMTAFELEPFELDALLICLAPCLDLRYERLYGYLQDDLTRKRPQVSLALDLLCPPGAEKLLRLRHFHVEAPLIHNRLLEFAPDPGPGKPALLGCPLALNETVCAWLLGSYQPGAELAEHARLIAVECPAEAAAGEPPFNEAVTVFYGPDEAAQHAAALALAQSAARPLLRVELGSALDESAPALPVVQLALRDARLVGALPYLAGWDAVLQGGRTPPALLGELCAFPGSAIVAGQEAWQAVGLERRRQFRWQAFPVPGCAQRRELWRSVLGDAPQDAAALEALAGQFALTSGQIRDAAAAARDLCSGPPDAAGLFAAARAHSNPGLRRLAKKLSPRYGWEDIVLPADALAQLREIVAAVRGRPRVLDDWGLGRKLVSSRGVTALFSGQPGVGKTMAAEIVAGELGLDLYKIDLSTVVSKYVGETEKNLERIFAEAESSNAILFFDEADALFGKRSEVRDAHDRYANVEISYLLQRMEAYDGVTILATNLRANLDEAFTRRLQYSVDFPFPDEADRLRIWRQLFPESAPHVPDLDLPLLAQRFKLAGGSIRNILVSAAYLAAADGQCVTMEHLLHGAKRELQKMGKLAGEEEGEGMRR